MIINTGLLPATVFVLNALMIDIGQLTPKQTSIRVSKILIISRFFKFHFITDKVLINKEIQDSDITPSTCIFVL